MSDPAIMLLSERVSPSALQRLVLALGGQTNGGAPFLGTIQANGGAIWVGIDDTVLDDLPGGDAELPHPSDRPQTVVVVERTSGAASRNLAGRFANALLSAYPGVDYNAWLAGVSPR